MRLSTCQWPNVGLEKTKSCYDIILLTIVLIGRDGGLSTLSHSCRFDYRQRMLVLKTYTYITYIYLYIVTLYAFLFANVTKYKRNDKTLKIQLYFDSYKSSTG